MMVQWGGGGRNVMDHHILAEMNNNRKLIDYGMLFGFVLWAGSADLNNMTWDSWLIGVVFFGYLIFYSARRFF